jgi:hypothetical protein
MLVLPIGVLKSQPVGRTFSALTRTETPMSLDGLRVMMWEDGNGNFIFTHPVPHMTPQYHVLTTLTAGYPVVTKVRATN